MRKLYLYEEDVEKGIKKQTEEVQEFEEENVKNERIFVGVKIYRSEKVSAEAWEKTWLEGEIRLERAPQIIPAIYTPHFAVYFTRIRLS